MASWSLDGVDLPEVELSGSEDEEELEIDDEGYYNEEDRYKLSALSMLERESILYERKKKQKERKDRASALSRYSKTVNKAAAADAASKSKAKDAAIKRSRKSSLGASGGKEAALASIRKRKKKGSTMKRIEEIDSESDFEDEEFEEVSSKSAAAAAAAAKKKVKFGESDESDDDEGQSGASEKPKRPLKLTNKTKTPLTLQTLSSMQIRRRKLEKMHFEGWFDQFVTGLFVRLYAGLSKNSGTPLYFVAEIVAVAEYHRKYQFGPNFTKRALMLSHPTFEDKLWKMTDISDSDFTQEEMNVWFANMKKAGKEILSAEEAAQRVIDAQAYRKTYKHTPEEISRLIQQRKDVEDNPANLTREIIELDLKLQKLRKAGDSEEAEKLSYKLDALKEQEELLRRRSDTQSRQLMTGLKGGPKVSGGPNSFKKSTNNSGPGVSTEESAFSPESIYAFEVKDADLPSAFLETFQNFQVPKEMKILAKFYNVPLNLNLNQTQPSRKRKYPTAFGNRFTIYPYAVSPKEFAKSLPSNSLSMNDYIARRQAQPQQRRR